MYHSITILAVGVQRGGGNEALGVIGEKINENRQKLSRSGAKWR